MRISSKTGNDGRGREGRMEQLAGRGPWSQMAGGQGDQGGRDTCRIKEWLTSEVCPDANIFCPKNTRCTVPCPDPTARGEDPGPIISKHLTFTL